MDNSKLSGMSETDSETVALDGLERTTNEMTGATVM